MLEGAVNLRDKSEEVQEQLREIRLGLEDKLRELIKNEISNLPFEEIARMSPSEPGGDPFIRDINGIVLRGILLHQIPDFAQFTESNDSYLLHGLIKEVYLLDNGSLKFYERKISKGEKSSESFFRAGIKELWLEDFDLEIIIDHLESIKGERASD